MEGAGAELDALASQHYTHPETRKPASYWLEYGRVLGERRQTQLRLLELGVADGSSMSVWRDYLPKATIVGIDVAEGPRWIEAHHRVHFLRGSQDDPTLLDRAAAVAGGKFDLIVDDASHLGFLTKRSFSHLFPRWLAAGGHYAIEDFGTAFRPEYPDACSFVSPPDDDARLGNRIFSSHQYGMMGFIKQLQDHMMQQLMTGLPSKFEIESITLRANLAVIRKCL